MNKEDIEEVVDTIEELFKQVDKRVGVFPQTEQGKTTLDVHMERIRELLFGKEEELPEAEDTVKVIQAKEPLKMPRIIPNLSKVEEVKEEKKDGN